MQLGELHEIHFWAFCTYKIARISYRDTYSYLNDLFDSVKAIRDHHKQCKGDDLSGFGYLDVINICQH
jgi:hypothetical protein